MRVAGREIRPVLLGDSAYPLSTWLLKPYHEGTNDPEEINFNKELSRARVSVECAFGILKGRWRILQKRLDSDIAFTNQIIIACCVLHNFCIEAGDYGMMTMMKMAMMTIFLSKMGMLMARI